LARRHAAPVVLICCYKLLVLSSLESVFIVYKAMYLKYNVVVEQIIFLVETMMLNSDKQDDSQAEDCVFNKQQMPSFGTCQRLFLAEIVIRFIIL
jgi:hypothetical protein